MKDLFRFIGKDGSMGYRKGQVYMLEIWGYQQPVIKAPILVPPHTATQIPYTSWNALLENWERV